ncbi:MAG: hypothetical protein A2998_03420 [Candidatus Staskawiczbacteria bacterium RIFCSPLOWO2_01_FULL_37_25b]|uniref:Uncharacterized protein n=1 Tax=Candidatus Staskawiczbacteria bacterium RIFCSPLOWO2_01_FULL_37_25b TaxID=1802213 RepID=A0A1G2IBS2_9BACT|nr:MAG: hypothetical protein A2998_03420 [Candidatus Staskawiczbacteria bacterium RIFCSPLOWO2_01_FULL_37_25b]
MEEKRGKDDNDIEVLCREYQEGKISKVELDKKLGNLFDKNFPMFAKGFFRFNGQIFMAKEVRKKILFGLIGNSISCQGYVFDKSVRNWKSVSKEIFLEAAEKGENIKELPEDIKNENKF